MSDDEHPDEWWEVATVDNCVFRVDESIAREVVTDVKERRKVISFFDIYDTECVLMGDKISALWQVTRAVRDGVRLRNLMFDREQKEFDAAHATPEWEE
jgi:hypothetical protein